MCFVKFLRINYTPRQRNSKSCFQNACCKTVGYCTFDTPFNEILSTRRAEYTENMRRDKARIQYSVSESWICKCCYHRAKTRELLRETQWRAKIWHLRLSEDKPEKTQNISSHEVCVILLCVIFVASRRFDFDSEPWLSRSAMGNRDGNRVYSSPPFLIIRVRKHQPRNYCRGTQRVEMTSPQLQRRIDMRRWYEKHEPTRKALSWLGDAVSPALYSALCV